MTTHPHLFDRLEPRRLMSVDVTDGVLTIVGTPTSDRIVVLEEEFRGRPKAFSITVAPLYDGPGETYRIPAEGVRSLKILALGGNDLVDLAIATYPVPAVVGIYPVRTPSHVDGGVGD